MRDIPQDGSASIIFMQACTTGHSTNSIGTMYESKKPRKTRLEQIGTHDEIFEMNGR